MHNIQHSVKITRPVNKKENVTHKWGGGQSIERGTEFTNILELAENDSLKAITNMFEDFRENVNIMKREMETFKKKDK